MHNLSLINLQTKCYLFILKTCQMVNNNGFQIGLWTKVRVKSITLRMKGRFWKFQPLKAHYWDYAIFNFWPGKEFCLRTILWIFLPSLLQFTKWFWCRLKYQVDDDDNDYDADDDRWHLNSSRIKYLSWTLVKSTIWWKNAK